MTSAPLLAILGTLFVLAPCPVRAEPWKPAPGHEQILLWPKGPPDESKTAAESEVVKSGEKPKVGPTVSSVSFVRDPTLTIYPPQSASSRAAVLVFPGGGYKSLAIELEGTEVCDWLTRLGITCVLVKYRVPWSGPAWDPACRCHKYPKVFTALQDAQRALGLVRSRADEWKIDRDKIGVIGFSAGGHLGAALSTNFQTRIYAPVDDADRQSCRPDFAILLYPGHMSIDHDRDLSRLHPGLPVTPETPPTFLLHAEDDPVDPVEYSLLYYAALRKAKVPVEMHLYSEGGHAFALRKTDQPITAWTSLAEVWLAQRGAVQRP